jgi:hypothetical protein
MTHTLKFENADFPYYNFKSSQSPKFDLEHGNFFIEQFYTIGIDSEIIFDEFLYNSTLESLNENSRLKSTVISKYPHVEKKNLKLDESVLIKVSIKYFQIFFVTFNLIFHYFIF